MASIYDLVQQKVHQARTGPSQYTDPTAGIGLEIIKLIESNKDKSRVAALTSLDSLNSMLAGINSPEGMIKWRELHTDVMKNHGHNDQVKLYGSILDNSASQWSQDYSMYTSAIDEASDYINSDAFPHDEDYYDLDELVSKTQFIPEEGLSGKSKIKYLTAEKEKLNKFEDKISLGFGADGKTKKFHYKGKDREVIRRIQHHKNEIEIAIQTLKGDGILTEDEAYYIDAGRTDWYEDAYKEKTTAAEFGIKHNVGRIKEMDAAIRRVAVGNLNAADVGMFNIPTTGLQYKMNEKGEYLLDANKQPILVKTSKDYVIEHLNTERLIYVDELNKSNQKWKDWTGDDYLDTGMFTIKDLQYSPDDKPAAYGTSTLEELYTSKVKQAPPGVGHEITSVGTFKEWLERESKGLTDENHPSSTVPKYREQLISKLKELGMPIPEGVKSEIQIKDLKVKKDSKWTSEGHPEDVVIATRKGHNIMGRPIPENFLGQAFDESSYDLEQGIIKEDSEILNWIDYELSRLKGRGYAFTLKSERKDNPLSGSDLKSLKSSMKQYAKLLKIKNQTIKAGHTVSKKRLEEMDSIIKRAQEVFSQQKKTGPLEWF